MDKTELCYLAEKYITDKCIKYRHNYTPYYFNLLSKYKHSFKNILEIGVGFPGKPGSGVMEHVTDLGYQKGASLKMWREFFPNAHIWGFDINDEAMFEDERITTFLVNQTDTHQIQSICEKQEFDFIIDDGSHKYVDQIKSFKILHSFLKEGGIYIIEDLDPEYWTIDNIKELRTYAIQEYKFKEVIHYDIRKDTNFKINDDIFIVLFK